MDKKAETIRTYNNSAASLANKFDTQGARVSDIDETFALVQKENPRVLEIGCGNGRDAEEILKRTNDYIGIDISEELIALARAKVPQGRFEVQDIENYDFPQGLDIIFAFASLIHVPKESMSKILLQALTALNAGGIARLSLKYSDEYAETTKEDEFGVRTYYLYSAEGIKKLSPGFSVLKNELHDLRGQKWLEVILQKQS